MATRGQQRPWLTPPWEPLNFPDSGPPPTVGGLEVKGPRPSPPGVPPHNNSDVFPARSLQLQPHARCSVSGGGDLRQPGAGSRGGPSQGPPRSTSPHWPAPERCWRVGRGSGQSQPPAPAAQLEAAERKVPGPELGGGEASWELGSEESTFPVF